MLKILIICHDAGGANILASLVNKYRSNFDWKIFVCGPARKIFIDNKINSYLVPRNINESDVKFIIKSYHPNLILTGTGEGGGFLEFKFIRIAKNYQIPTASFIDNWTRFCERFGYPRKKWEKNLPDFIFVSDKWAYRIALKNGLPRNKLRTMENPYFEEAIKEANRSKKNNSKKISDGFVNILYVSNPLYESALKYHGNPYKWGYTEYEVVDDLLNIILLLQSSKCLLRMKIRLHPAEKNDKFSSLFNKKEVKGIINYILLSNPRGDSLVKDCLWADIVIGNETMALVVAMLVGKKAISYMPGEDARSILPQKEITKIKSFDELLYEIESFKRDKKARKLRQPFVCYDEFLKFMKEQFACH